LFEIKTDQSSHQFNVVPLGRKNGIIYDFSWLIRPLNNVDYDVQVEGKRRECYLISLCSRRWF